MKMTPQEIRALNEDRYTFKAAHTSTKYKGYKRLPGHVLVEEFLVPYYPAQLKDLATRTGIPLIRLEKLIRGTDRIDSRMAKSLGAFYGNGADFWTDIQTRFEKGESL
jgi:plasmid maintenance system antidote protein VapI